MSKSKKKEENNHKAVESLIKSGSEIAGAAAGGALGFFAAGPAGAAAGSVGGALLTQGLSKLGVEIKKRILGDREEVRIGATMAYSIQKIEENLKNGKRIREDDFFEKDASNRSDADEIYEGLIKSAKSEHEEKKIKYYGNLLGNIPFHSVIDKPFANQLIKIAENLSYHQLCILQIYHLNTVANSFINLRKANYREFKDFNRKLVTVLYDTIELANQNLIINNHHHVLGITDIIPSEFKTMGNGKALVDLMELKDIPQNDLYETQTLLSN